MDKYIGNKHKISRLYTVKEFPDGTKPEKKLGTFDSTRALDNENLEFLAFGNPIVDHLVDVCRDESFGGCTGVKIIRYRRKISGMIFYYIVNFDSISKHRELIPVFIPDKNLLNDFELEEIELEALEDETGMKFRIDKYNNDIERISHNPDKYFQAAGDRIIKKIGVIIRRLSDNLDGSIGLEIEKINDSYNKKIKEYEEQLERQVCQMKWFNKDMRSAITRTKNRISKEQSERETILAGYRNYLDVGYSIEMLSAGILITLV